MDTGAAARTTRILLTGPPGIGKTTVCKKVASLLTKRNCKFDGFYTEEVRNQSHNRIGFDVVRIKNPEDRLPLARSENTLSESQRTKHRVGNYHVFVKDFERIALPIFNSDADLLLIDEIGKMELFSLPFEERVKKLFFDSAIESWIIATIPQVHKVPHRHLPLFQKLKSDEKSRIIEVSRQNRDSLPEKIVSLLFDIE